MTADGLFAEPERAVEPVPEDGTPGERRRARHLEVIALGRHPLSLALGYPIRLHEDAPRDGRRDDDGTPRCGTCVHRVVKSHRSRTYPKCYAEPHEATRRADEVDRRLGRVPDDGFYRWTAYPRASHGEGTDVASWWPACTDHTPREDPS